MQTARLYVYGSVLFIMASLLLHPVFVGYSVIYLIAVSGFIGGSACFSGAGWLGLRAAWRTTKAPRHLALIPASLSLAGGLFFLIGSFAYLPIFNYAMIGTYIFRLGSCSYICSSLWGVLAMALQYRRQGLQHVLTAIFVAYIGGALLFITGGVMFLQQYPAYGSLAWTIGSGFFLAGSILSLRQFSARSLEK